MQNASQRVEQMAAAGEVTRAARGLLLRTSVERRAALTAGRRARTWGSATAWAAIAHLGGEKAAWLGASQYSRPRSTLRTMDDGAVLAARCRNRATVTTWTAHRSVRSRIAEDLITVDTTRLGLADVVGQGLDAGINGYLAAADLEPLVRRTP